MRPDKGARLGNSVRVFVFFLGTCCFAPPLYAAKPPPEYANDLGPSEIDVSRYPPEMKQAYRLFQKKCTFCHTAARAINSEFVESKQWTRYVQRMYMRPPCCDSCPLMSHDDAKAIWGFLVYDSQVRKTDAQAEAWARFRKSLLEEFKSKYPKLYQQRYETQPPTSKETP
jgi:hypothetical protein